MRDRCVAWLQRQMRDGRMLAEGGVRRFALHLALKTTLIANLIDAVLHIGLDALGLLPYPLGPALALSLVFATVISFSITLLVGLVIGQAIRDLAVSRDSFERLSSIDMLSGLWNRRAFIGAFEAARADAVFVLMDVDRFKSINDTFGHLAGDDVIRAIGHTLPLAFAGTGARVGRLGGEEFAVLLPLPLPLAGQGEAMLRQRVEQARRAIAEMTVAGISVPVTVSAGIATASAGRPIREVFAAADEALYLAKTCGRNRIVHESEIGLLKTLGQWVA